MATIRELLAKGPTFSFELMPPRTPERERQLAQTVVELEPLRPSFVSITYGAGGSTRERTHELVHSLLTRGSMTPMAHLTCAGHTKAELQAILDRYRDDGLENLLALRGDPPLNSNGDLPEGELRRASDLVELARESGDFCVAVAAHPESHPQAPDLVTDRKRQAAKIATADFAVTQFFFRASDYLRFVEDMRGHGIDQPILPGFMPPSNVAQLTKMAQLSGAQIPVEIGERLAAAGDNPDDLRKIGVEIVTELARAVLDEGAPGVHIYTMNRSAATRDIFANLGMQHSFSASSEEEALTVGGKQYPKTAAD